MLTWKINRRTVEDQVLYVKAYSLEDALTKVREFGLSDVQGDVKTVKVTLRSLGRTIHE